MKSVDEIARVTHEINRAYCEACGDHSQVAWEDAPEWQRESAIQGVIFALVNPGNTPEQMHEQWMKGKDADGWVYGPVKCAIQKTHPCMRPYSELPVEQRAKDHLFRAVVRSLA